jgi:Protein of unknown function (DUF2452)
MKKENDSEEIQLPDLKHPYPTRTGDAPIHAMEKWLEADRKPIWIEAKREIKAQAIRKLELLEAIHQELIEKAQTVIDDANQNVRLHNIPINAAKIRGKIYYLYRRQEGENWREFFSILSPEEHIQADSQAEFLAAYRLNEDSSWTLLTPLTADDSNRDISQDT